MLEALVNLFVSPAYAQTIPTTPASASGGGFSFILIFGVFFLFLYFGILRPQNKRAKEQQNLLLSLAKGDEVMTAGGLLGKITKIQDQYLGLSIANNVDVVVQKSAVVSVLPKGTLKSFE